LVNEKGSQRLELSLLLPGAPSSRVSRSTALATGAEHGAADSPPGVQTPSTHLSLILSAQ